MGALNPLNEIVLKIIIAHTKSKCTFVTGLKFNFYCWYNLNNMTLITLHQSTMHIK